ncbi:GntR family transcriptional regulator [Streptomyces sp. NPDC005438]|uniref:GntR family transcriptional regulator n=1 Tax=Streptomyces sp. NPDC005438 TaxID=3156880 RepID=UPI00339FCF61
MATTQAAALPEPKYWHLKTVLLQALDEEFTVGEILPNERELAARFGVARATLRQALEQLELEGRLQRRRGVGTTVAPPRVRVDVGSPQAQWPGPQDASWRIEGSERSPWPSQVARLFAPGWDHGPAVRRTRGQSTEGVAPRSPDAPVVATEVLYVPEELTAGATDGAALLSALDRLPLDGQERDVELGSAPAQDARLLDRLPGAPVLIVTTRYLSGGRTAAVSVATYRADTCRLTFGDADPVTVNG